MCSVSPVPLLSHTLFLATNLRLPCLVLLLVAPLPHIAPALCAAPCDWSQRFYVHLLYLLSKLPTGHQQTTQNVEINYICPLPSQDPPPSLTILTSALCGPPPSCTPRFSLVLTGLRSVSHTAFQKKDHQTPGHLKKRPPFAKTSSVGSVGSVRSVHSMPASIKSMVAGLLDFGVFTFLHPH